MRKGQKEGPKINLNLKGFDKTLWEMFKINAKRDKSTLVGYLEDAVSAYIATFPHRSKERVI